MARPQPIYLWHEKRELPGMRKSGVARMKNALASLVVGHRSALRAQLQRVSTRNPKLGSMPNFKDRVTAGGETERLAGCSMGWQELSLWIDLPGVCFIVEDDPRQRIGRDVKILTANRTPGVQCFLHPGQLGLLDLRSRAATGK